MPSDIDLCSWALLRIGAHRISSFADGTTEAQVAAGIYPHVRDAMLAGHFWNFAVRVRALAEAVETPAADWAAAYPLPVDCLRVISVGTGTSSRGGDYAVVGRAIHAAAGGATLAYIARVVETDWPAYFADAIAAQLAAEFVIPLTDQTSRWEGLTKLADAAVRRARLIDAQAETPRALDDWSLITSRG